MQDVVRVAAADAGHGVLIAQHRVHAPAVCARSDQIRELLRIWLGPERRERTLFAGREHPPRGLPFGSELFDEQPALAEDEANDRTFRTRRLRLLLDVDAAALRQVYGHARALELHHEELPAAADGHQLL